MNNFLGNIISGAQNFLSSTVNTVKSVPSLISNAKDHIDDFLKTDPGKKSTMSLPELLKTGTQAAIKGPLGYVTDAAKHIANSIPANSTAGIIKNTAAGIPRETLKMGQDLGRQALRVPFSAGESVGRMILNKPGGQVGGVDVPGFGHVDSYQSEVVKKIEEGGSKKGAIGSAALDIATNEPLGIAFKPLGIAGSLFMKSGGKQVVEEGTKLAEKGIFSAEQYVKEQIAKREAARVAEGKPGFISNLYNQFKSKFVDFTAPIEDAIYKAQKESGIKFSPTEVTPHERMHDQIDMALRAPTLAGKFMEDNGLKEVIKSTDNLDNLDQYLVAKQAIDVNTRGFATGRDLTKDQALVQQFGPKYEAAAQKINQYSKNLLDYSVQSGVVSPELATKLKEIYPNYVPMNRVFNELEKEGSAFGQKGVANLSNQTIVQKLQGSEREVESPFASLLQKTQDAFSQGEKNKAAQILTDMADKPEGKYLNMKPIATEGQITDRLDTMSKLKDFKPIQQKIENIYTNKTAEIRSLKSEINNLNKEGLSTSLRKEYKASPEKLKSAIKETIKPEEYKVNAPNSFDGLTNSYGTKDRLKKEFGNFDFLKLDLKLGGWNRLVELGIPQQEAESVARQIFKEPTYKPAESALSDVFAEMNNKDPKKFIESLLLDDNSALESIKRKIGNREDKVGRFVAELQNVKDSLEGVKSIRKDLWDHIQSLSASKKNPEMDTINVYRNGVKETWEMPKDIAAAAKNLNSQQLNIIGKILAFPTRIAKIGITGINIPFIGANVVKDQVDAFINSNASFRSSVANPAVFFKGLVEAIGHGKLYDEFVRNGAGGTSFDIARNAATESVEKIRAGKNVVSKIAYTIRHPGELLRAIEDVVGRSEELTRLMQYEGTKRAVTAKGGTINDAIIKGRIAARENTVNFARRGEWGQVLNSAFLYLNAGIQGSRLILKNATEKPLQTAAKIATALYLPVAVTTTWNISDPKRKEAYMDIQDYEKEGNLIIIPPNPTKDAQGRWNVWKIPLPAGYKALTVPVRKMVEATHDISKVGFGDMAQALFGTFSPIGSTKNEILSTLTPQAIKPTIQAQTNTNLFTGLPIVPTSMEKLSPKNQVKPYTSGTARKIGAAGNWSPIQVEEFIKGTFGSVGSQGLNASDRVLAGLDVIPKDQIGGQGIIEGVVARFAKARGGALDVDTTKQLKDILTKQADDRFVLKQNAEVLYNEMSKLSKNEANAKFKEIEKTNKPLATSLKDVINASKKGLDYNDRLVLQLGVENGERAKFIYQNYKTYKTAAEKKQYIGELRLKGIATRNVLSQLAKLSKESK